MAQAERKLKQLGFTLPKPPAPVANYVRAVRTGNLVFLSGAGPVTEGGIWITGKLGADLKIEDGAPTFTDQPKVINGCSDLLVNVFGEKGRHARSAVGMGALPMNIAVEIEAVAEVRD